MPIKHAGYFLPGLFILAYPPVFVFSLPAATASLSELAAALSASLIIWLVLAGVGRVLFRQASLPARRAGLMTTVLSLVVITYGHVYSLSHNAAIKFHYAYTSDNIPDIGIKVFLEVFYLLVAFWVAQRAWQALATIRENAANSAHTITLFFASAMLVMASYSAVQHQRLINVSAGHGEAVSSSPSGHDLPDIYHIVLDGYARHDILEEFYHFDNSPFLSELEQLGFSVSDNSLANYGWTTFSLSSMLNMRYLTPDLIQPGDNLRHKATGLIQDSAAVRALKAQGYHYIHMASTWGPTRFNNNADRLRRCSKGFMQSDYYRALVEGSLLRALSFLASQNLALCHKANFQWLGDSAGDLPQPSYVFAHFILPHHPYLFDAEGNTLANANLSDQFDFQAYLWSDRASYLAQMQYVNQQIISAIKRINANSNSDPVIIIQSDHGPQLVNKTAQKDPAYLRGRAAILLAIKGPQDADPIPTSAINIYPWLFNAVLGEKQPYLPFRYYQISRQAGDFFREIPLPELTDTNTAAAPTP